MAGGLGHVGAQLEVVLHGRTAKVEVTVLQSHVFAGQLVLGLVFERGGHLERQRIGLGEHIDGLDDDFDLAGGQMRVLVAVRAQTNLAGDLDDKLGAQRARHLLVVDDDLHQAGVVAQIDERHAAVIAATIDPTCERHLLTDECFGHLGGMMCSVSRLAHASSFLCNLCNGFPATRARPRQRTGADENQSITTVCRAYTVSGCHDLGSAGC